MNMDFSKLLSQKKTIFFVSIPSTPSTPPAATTAAERSLPQENKVEQNDK